MPELLPSLADPHAPVAEISLPELKALNHDINPDRLVEGQTILLPGGKLSERDRDILSGIGPTTYRCLAWPFLLLSCSASA